jgi:hypothetical protein
LQASTIVSGGHMERTWLVGFYNYPKEKIGFARRPERANLTVERADKGAAVQMPERNVLSRTPVAMGFACSFRRPPTELIYRSGQPSGDCYRRCPGYSGYPSPLLSNSAGSGHRLNNWRPPPEFYRSYRWSHWTRNELGTLIR